MPLITRHEINSDHINSEDSEDESIQFDELEGKLNQFDAREDEVRKSKKEGIKQV